MKYDPNKHHRRSIRLKGYDYTQAGAYFVTICTWQRTRILGDVVNGEMQLSRFGQTVQFNWDNLPKRYPHVQLDAFIVMPNHVHGIIVLPDKYATNSCKVGENLVSVTGMVGAGLEMLFTQDKSIVKHAPTKVKFHGLPENIRGFKTFSARRINQIRCMAGVPVWQRGYYEHIIRNETSLQEIRKYIINNSLFWEKDQLHTNKPCKWNEARPLVFEGKGGLYTQGIVL